MSPKALLVLDFIKAYIKKHGVSPSYEVMAKAFGMTAKSNMHRLVGLLERGGYVRVNKKKFYGIKVVDRSVDDVVKL